MNLNENIKGTVCGVLFVMLFSLVAYYLSTLGFVKSLSFSPLIVGLILAMIYANTFRSKLPKSYNSGLALCAKKALRLGIILYGFKVSVQDVMLVGPTAILIDVIVVTVTICFGIFVGKLLKIDGQTALLTSVGSAICGAAAVLGAEATMKVQPYKTTVAVSTVVIFGTLSMLLYPILYKLGVYDFNYESMGIYVGATIHEVAHAVGAGNAISDVSADFAIITKMIRVILLVPVLLIISLFIAIKSKNTPDKQKGKIQIPWFAILFLIVILFNSLNLLPQNLIDIINILDTFLLTMAMVALGMDTQFEKFKQAGAKPFLLAGILYVCLVFGGYVLVSTLV